MPGPLNLVEEDARASRGLDARALASRALLVAIVFWVARLLGGAALSAVTGAADPDPIAELAAGLILAGTLGWATPRLPGSTADRVAIVGIALFANVAAVMVEGAAFAPAASPVDRLPLALLVQALVSLVVAIVAVGLLPGDESRSSLAPRHGPRWWAVRLAATTSVYAVAYFITGGINYALVTGPYYESHAGGLVTPALQVVLGVALLEGLLMSVGMLPLVRHLRAGRRASLIAPGLVLFSLGGLMPLIQQAHLPDVIRTASAIEIFFQKVPLGIALAVLFRVGERPQDSRLPVGAKGDTGALKQADRAARPPSSLRGPAS